MENIENKYNSQYEDIKIIQRSFLGLKGSICFDFKKDGLYYKIDEKNNKEEKKYKYDEIYGLKGYSEVNRSELYYILVGILFGIYGLIMTSLFFIAFSLVFLFLYYKSKENFITLNYDLFINKDSKMNQILDELKKRKTEFAYEIYEDSSRYDEELRLKSLLDNGIFTNEEYDNMLLKLDDIYPENNNEKGYMKVISSLLLDKGIDANFTIQDYTFENRYVPGGHQSFSGVIVISDKEKYNFWFDWDKEIKSPIDNKKGYYTLGDTKGVIKEFGREFFFKIKEKKEKK